MRLQSPQILRLYVYTDLFISNDSYKKYYLSCTKKCRKKVKTMLIKGTYNIHLLVPKFQALINLKLSNCRLECHLLTVKIFKAA